MYLIDFLLFEVEKFLSILQQKIYLYRIKNRVGIDYKNRKNLKLNIGCGGVRKKGFIGIDIILGPGVDIKHDILNGVPFQPNSVSAILMSHVLEHLPHNKNLFVLRECSRVLKKGGTLIVEVPDLERILKDFLATDEEERWTSKWDHIFGNQKTPYEYHKTGFTRQRLSKLLTHAGFQTSSIKSYNKGAIPSIRAKSIKI